MCWRKIISSSIGPCDQLLDLSILWFECGLSSNQISTNDARNVVLLVVFPRAYTVIFLGLTNANTLFTWLWSSIYTETWMNCCWAHRQHLGLLHDLVEHYTSVGNLCKHFLHDPFVKHMFGRKRWVPLINVHLMQVAAMNLRRLVLPPLESSQVSHAYVRSMLWSGDLQPSFHMCPEHTKPPIDLFKENKFLLKSMPYARTSISLLMVPPPELGSVLL